MRADGQAGYMYRSSVCLYGGVASDNVQCLICGALCRREELKNRVLQQCWVLVTEAYLRTKHTRQSCVVFVTPRMLSSMTRIQKQMQTMH